MLAIENLDVFYGDAQALDGVSLTVGQGEIVAIVGANGAGKTSLIRAIAGMVRPAAGRVLLHGSDIAGLPTHRICDLGIGQVAEGRQVFPTMTVLENLEMGALLPRARGHQAKNLERVLAMFPILVERSGQAAGTLSGGEQQMLAIGRALIGNPKLLLVDEPSEGLAPIIVNEIFEALVQMRDEGLSLLLVEQNVRRAAAISNACYVMEKGRIIAQGVPAQVMADETIRQRLSV